MSFGRKESEKDLVFFIDKQDLEVVDESQSQHTKAAPIAADDNTSPNDTVEAFNPRTGEINWDCPCLGGMAYGPCGEQFKTAFTCFVFSESEPKGADCVPLFQTMQNCFQDYPEYYADQLAHDNDHDSRSRGTSSDDTEAADSTISKTEAQKAQPP